MVARPGKNGGHGQVRLTGIYRSFTSTFWKTALLISAFCLGGADADAQQTLLRFSTAGGAEIPDVAAPYSSGDIYGYDGMSFSRIVSASTDLDLPSSANVDAFSVSGPNTFYLSFSNSEISIPGLGRVFDQDVVKYDDGAWSLYFSGATCGLDIDDKGDIDAIDVVDGVLYFSTVGNLSVSGLPGADDADIYTWAEGATSCARQFDASEHGLPPNADVDALVVLEGNYYVSFNRNKGTSVPNGVGLTADEAIVVYEPASQAWALFFDGNGLNLADGQDIDAASFVVRAVGLVSVPGVVGLAQAEAEAAIVAAGLTANVTTAYSATVTAGLVISQDPGAAAQVAPGSTVDLVISLGEQLVSVPGVVGLAQAEAEAAIVAAGLTANVTTAYSATVTAGLVISQDPGAAAQVAPGSTVDLVISLGEQLVSVPGVVGLAQAEAEAAIVAAGLTANVTTAYSATVTAGLVISQDPGAAAQVAPGSTVDLVISLGEQLVSVPGVVGLAQAEAEAAIVAAGLTANVTTAYSATVTAGLVISQDPGAAAQVAPGSTVDLVISLGEQLVSVPGVVGLAQAEAEAAIVAAGLTANVTTAYSATVTAGLVISQDPGAAAQVAPGSTVDLVISLGEQLVSVPGVVGLAQAEAEAAIVAAGLTANVTTAYSATVTAGLVISQDPGAAAQVAPGSTVDLVISLGEQLVSVPGVVGLAQAEAEAAIVAAGLTANVTTAYSATVTAGLVISQDPGAAAQVAPGSTVDLVISLGEQLVSVPGVVGLAQAEAEAAIVAAGLTANVTTAYSATVTAGLVISQDPGAAAQVAPGSTVDLVISLGEQLVSVPGVVGLAQAEAEAAIVAAGLTANVTTAYSATVTAGLVISQDPGAAAQVAPGSTVDLVISLGEQLVSVPGVVGLAQAEAEAAIVAAGLTANVTTAYSATVTAGLVISQDPGAAAQVAPGSTVDLVISLGEQLVSVPGVVGLAQAEAEAAIVAAGLTANVTTAYSATVTAGLVISQDPGAAAQVAPGSTVDLVISLGEQLVSVPGVVGLAQAEAEAAIVAAGLTANVTTAYSATVTAGLVISQDPGAAAQVAPGSTVDLVISLGEQLVSVPGVVGLAQAEAEAAIVAAGLTANVTTAYSATVTAGLVISQDPGAAAQVAPGSTVDLVISLGEQLVSVPGVVGLAQAEAEAAIVAAGLTANVTTAYSATVTAGLVISQDPGAAAQVAPGSTVDLVISLGEQLVSVPGVVGLAQAEAEAAIVAAGLTANVTTAYSATVTAGLVISQDPGAAAQVAPGSTVDLVISLGEQLVSVPGVVGLAQAEAEAAIVAAGLTANVTTAYSATVTAGLVISQDPGAAAQVAPGSTVDLVISLGEQLVSARLQINSPAEGETVPSSTVNVTYTTVGVAGDAEHAHFQLDDGADMMVMSLSGEFQLSDVGAGAHTLSGYLARADHSRIVGSDALAVSFSADPLAPDDPAIIGLWANETIDLPTVAVNLVLLHTERAIFWAGDNSTAPNYGELWDPVTNLITPVPNPFSNIFCSAHVALADGRLLVAGGHDKQNGILGIADSNTFDPVREQWSSLPDMAFRRWYPTLTMLGDGRAIITSGSSDSESVFVDTPEIYDPVANAWTTISAARLSVPQYPMVFLLADGRVIQVGSTEYPTATHVLDLDLEQWTTLDANIFEGGSAVMYAPGRIMKSGSASQDGATPNAASADTTYVLDMNASAPSWRETSPMAFARTFHNLTSLPDGSVLVTSGSRRKSEIDLGPAVLEAELWSPDSETWTTMAPMRTPRIYHSTAILLPDGRVAVSGSGNIGGATDQENLEIYSPPYLFKGARPTIAAAPTQLAYGTTFTVETPDAADIQSVSLLRPGAATHNFDQDQRFVPLEFSLVGGALEVRATTNPNVAPPGYYMLFLVNRAGVPSVAEFVRFPAPYEDSEPPGVPGNLAVTSSVASASLEWEPANDNEGVAGYRVFRSTSQGFAPSMANRVGESTTTSFLDVGLPSGTYYFVVSAFDFAGNFSQPSNEVVVTVTADATPPLVSISSPLDGSTVSAVAAVSATASDDVGVAGVQFKLNGESLGVEDTVPPYSIDWNTVTVPNGTHMLSAVARDFSGNTTESISVSLIVLNTQQVPTGLVAAYGFEEGSGLSVADASGNGNSGAILGAMWMPEGRFGSALSFNGIDDQVVVTDSASLDLTNGMTVSAWVYPLALNGWGTVVMKETSDDLAYALYADNGSSRPAGYVKIGGSTYSVTGNSSLALNLWTHLALTYDGTTLRLFVDGVEQDNRALTGSIEVSSQPLRIGGNTVWSTEDFNGRLDEVRVFNRALSLGEIETDMGGSVQTGAKLMITAPLLNATISGATVDVSFESAGNLEEASHTHLRLDGGSDMMIMALSGQLQLSGVLPGSHVLDGYLVRADHSKIEGSDSASITFLTTLPDAVAPAVVVTNPRDGSTVSGSVLVSATASDDVGVAGVQFKLNGESLGVEDTVPPYSIDWNTVTVPNGTHMLSAVARDFSGNTTESISVSLIVLNTQQVPTGLVAAYGFEEGSGLSVADASGNGNSGAILGAMWMPEGRFGSALSFNGIDDQVVVTDSASLDLTNGMTVSAWVYPLALNGWGTVVMKETSDDLAYALYADNGSSRPAGYVKIGGSTYSVTGNSSLALNLWTHLALTYDGTTLRLFVDGVEQDNRALTGSIEVSSQPLRIGGNTVWSTEDFNGRLDEVRVFNRALSLAELQASIDAPVVIPAVQQPTRSSSIIVDSVSRRVWVVNPDTDSIAAIDADDLGLELEIGVGNHPTNLALDADGKIWVTCRDDDSLWVIDSETGAVEKTITTAWGSEPVGLVFAPGGSRGFVSLQGSGEIQEVLPDSQSLGRAIAVGRTPHALAITADGKRLLVTEFISFEQQGTILTVDLDNFVPAPPLALPLDTTSQDGSLAARGLPNYLAGLAINPAGSGAWVVAKKDNVLRGLYRDGNPLTFETTVRSMVGRLDLNVNQEQIDQRLDLDNQSQPSAIALSEYGDLAFVTTQGSNQLIVIDQLGTEITRATTGLAPQGVVLDFVANRAFTQDFMSRSVSVFDASSLLATGAGIITRVGQVQTISTEKLTPEVLRGKQIFYNAADIRMDRDGYLSCASCHIDGGHDGQVWDFTDRGEGLRNTISLRGQGGSAGAPLHWSGNFDEVQDFESDIRNFFGGTGFMSDSDYLSGSRREPLGDPKTGLSEDLDALAAYVDSLRDSGRSSNRNPDGTMTQGALEGQSLFVGLGCQSCHSGERFSDSPSGARHDVGTIKPSSGSRASGLLDGIDTPTLLGLWATGPYLHDGSASTLRDVLTTQNVAGEHADLSSLTSSQLDQVLEYLLQLELNPQ